MCTRYTLIADAAAVKENFQVDTSKEISPFYNAAPADILPVITHDAPSGLSYFYWGIPPEWARNRSVSNKLINAPLEQLLDKSSYRNALENRRCIIPADGFYAWKLLGKKTKIPYRFIRQDKELFAFAGIWEEFEGNEDAELYHTFIILTCPANKNVREVDERMPVILSKENQKVWMDKNATTEELIKVLKPYPDDNLFGYTVSNRIDIPGENSALLVKPSAPVDQHGNYSLFD